VPTRHRGFDHDFPAWCFGGNGFVRDVEVEWRSAYHGMVRRYHRVLTQPRAGGKYERSSHASATESRYYGILFIVTGDLPFFNPAWANFPGRVKATNI
jgi:hypothetical protein